jgi:hypothetical protein
MTTFYGILNGNLTTSKTCTRNAILDAVEEHGSNVWGVADRQGNLLVINRTLALADKWLKDRIKFLIVQNKWRKSEGLPPYETDGYTVVKVYPGKREAEAACQPAPAAQPAQSVADLRVGQTVTFVSYGEQVTILSLSTTDAHAFPCTVATVRTSDGAETTRTWPSDYVFDGSVVVA